MYNILILILIFLGILLIVVEVVKTNIQLNYKGPKVIYRYIPRTFQEEQLDPIPVTEIFETMFSQPSPWVNSLRVYDRRKQEKINQYFVNQL